MQAPNRKVGASGVAGALALVITWAWKEYGDTELPPDVAVGITFVLMSVVGYFVREPQQPSGGGTA